MVNAMEPGKVIVLNGTSSSGKSTLARSLQRALDDIYLHCSLDMFWHMTPESVPANSINFPKLKLALGHSVSALATTGHNVIVDIVHSGLQSHQELSAALDGIETLTVKVDCSLKELEIRELERGDRRLGLAKSQYDAVHQGIAYDLEIDTSQLTPAECVSTIIQKLETVNPTN
ncbi:AAA family ATPase [Parasphingorhabdus sp.]|uniref:chloramphenicol phosphotransferase CPT family protein n=1 Tax=Parasphingorhabdus sp. TaxID=2709688 RepID=UPI003262D7E5